MKMILLEHSGHVKQFLDLSSKINKGDPHRIRPLDKDIEAVFDKDKNMLFKRKGDTCEHWILVNDSGEVIGGFVAFVNRKYENTGDDISVAGISFSTVLITRRLRM